MKAISILKIWLGLVKWYTKDLSFFYSVCWSQLNDISMQYFFISHFKYQLTEREISNYLCILNLGSLRVDLFFKVWKIRFHKWHFDFLVIIFFIVRNQFWWNIFPRKEEAFFRVKTLHGLIKMHIKITCSTLIYLSVEHKLTNSSQLSRLIIIIIFYISKLFFPKQSKYHTLLVLCIFFYYFSFMK